ncbi:hypothetical protein B0H10DRAFT_1941189 [Mycena sp. CBHHK59/15]|nr:hypothetical protein B0H10DRAFT_1941189 [Mycena sp. CBHHK59/15]
MRFTAVAASFSLLSASVSAAHFRRQLPGIPDCANNCLNNPATLGGCQQTDEACLCKSLPFLQSTFSCIMAACQGADQQSAINGAENLCSAFGVTLSAESSAIVAGISTAASGATTTVSGGGAITSSAGSSATPAATNSPNSAASPYDRYIFAVAIAAGGVTAVLSTL